jgi:type VI secretion system protein ImpM
MMDKIIIPEIDPLTALGSSSRGSSQRFVSLSDGAEKLTGALSLFADYFMAQTNKASSVWWTSGSEHVAPMALISDKLPKPVSYTALLDGNWQNWYWDPM